MDRAATAAYSEMQQSEEAYYSLPGTLDQYEVDELSIREAGALLSQRKSNNSPGRAVADVALEKGYR